MGKIGRNEQCPCGSGKKFKYCCLPKEQAGITPTPRSPEGALKISLNNEIKEIVHAATEKRQKIKELGVFILMATESGDAWLLEITDSDAVQLARDGKPLEVPIDENPETIEINWSHTFDLSNKEFELISYNDKSKSVMAHYPAKEVSAAVKRIKKKFPQDILDQVHVPSADEGSEA